MLELIINFVQAKPSYLIYYEFNFDPIVLYLSFLNPDTVKTRVKERTYNVTKQTR